MTSETRHFTASAVSAALPYSALIDRIAAFVEDEVDAPQRVSARLKTGMELLVMPAIGRRYAGVKLITVVQANAARQLPVIGGVFVLFAVDDGRMLATMDAGELTGRRTAAVSALASRQLSRRESSRLLLCGSGRMIPYLAEAHAAVRPIRHVAVWARDSSKAMNAVQHIVPRLPGITVEIAADLDRAVASSDIVSAATSATEPFIHGACFRPGTHIDLIGSYRPDMREVDDAGVRSARIFVDNIDAALHEAGDLISPIAAGVIDASAIEGDLKAIIAGAGRSNGHETTLFKAVGSAVADLAAASLVWEASQADGAPVAAVAK